MSQMKMDTMATAPSIDSAANKSSTCNYDSLNNLTSSLNDSTQYPCEENNNNNAENEL